MPRALRIKSRLPLCGSIGGGVARRAEGGLEAPLLLHRVAQRACARASSPARPGARRRGRW